MTQSAVCVGIMACLIKIGADEIHPIQLVFFRNLFGLLFLSPWLIRVGFQGLVTTRITLYLVRSIFGLGALLTWFYALTAMPLTAAIALSFTVPLFCTVASPLFLAESVGLRRWCATLIGFAGVLIILRPGAEMVQLPALSVMASSLLLAGVVLTAKHLARTEPSGRIVFFNMLLLTALSLPPAALVWEWPDLPTLAIAVGIAATSTLDNIGFTRALKLSDAVVVVPFDYLRLPIVALMSYLLFSETMDIWGWIGATIIAGAAVEISFRESLTERRHKHASAAKTTTKSPLA